MDQKTIKEYIQSLEHMTEFMRSLLEENTPLMALNDHDRLSEITSLRLLAKSDRWPLALPKELICGEDENQKLARAADIANDLIRTDLTDKKLLDFGCGEGHVAYVAADLVGIKLAMGYDPIDQNWRHFGDKAGLQFSTFFEEVKKNGPYDVIVINDVLDHADQNILLKAKEVKTPNGRIYLRCHPWTSRHGTHLYEELNRAYLHLVFSTDELFGMGLKGIPTQKIIDPLKNYRKLIEEAGLSIAEEEIIKQPVEVFFTYEPAVLRRIKANWKKSESKTLAAGTEFPRDVLEIQFVDFILI
jgi:2-polyprenyl-3-methyl-5-hydroxy-6-metoxy-1,4-benzoquinol methylase